MKNYILAGVCCVALATSAVAFSGCNGSDDVEANGEGTTIVVSQQNTGIWVSGQGRMSVAPDVSLIYLGVEVEAATVEEAQAEAAEAMTDVINSLTQNGVDEADIQTQNYSIYTVYDWNDDGRKLVGYRVTNTVEAKIKTISETGEIIDDAVKAGGNYIRVNSVAFTVDDYTQYYSQVRELAVEDAKNKAEELAELNGVTLGKVTYITEGSFSAPLKYDNALRDIEELGASTTPISPGELEIYLSVQIVYEMS